MYNIHETTHLATICGLTILNLLAMGLDMYSTESIDVKVMSVYVHVSLNVCAEPISK